MNYIIKIFICFGIILFLNSCIINPKPEQCDVVEITVTDISEGSSKDIVFKDAGTDSYYINRGLKQGMNIKVLNKLLLGKKVTLYLPRIGPVQSEHIAQLTFNDSVVFTEFK